MNTKRAPKVRFKGFTDAWELRKLNEVAEFNPKSALPDTFEYRDILRRRFAENLKSNFYLLG